MEMTLWYRPLPLFSEPHVHALTGFLLYLRTAFLQYLPARKIGRVWKPVPLGLSGKSSQVVSFSSFPLQQGLLDNRNCLAWLLFVKTTPQQLELSVEILHLKAIQNPNEWMIAAPFKCHLKSIKWRFRSFGREQKWTVTVSSLCLGIGFLSSLPHFSALSAFPSPITSSHTHLNCMKFWFGCMPWRLNYARNVICWGVSFQNVIV